MDTCMCAHRHTLIQTHTHCKYMYFCIVVLSFQSQNKRQRQSVVIIIGIASQIENSTIQHCIHECVLVSSVQNVVSIMPSGKC